MVIGENASGCSSWSYNTLIITVTQPVPVSVTITASSNPAGAGQNVIFTAHPVNGGAYASYQWKVNGFAAGSTASTYTYQPADGDVVSCVLTSSLTCITGSPAMSNDITMTVTGIPANITITGTVSNGQENCYNATQTLTVAGGATTFVVETDGSATMIAGQNIIYLPGTTIHEGGYMHGYISTMYCGQQSPSIVNTITGNGELPLTSQNSSFTIYPNPTNGNFTLVIKGDKTYGNVTVEVYSMQGERVMTESMIGEQKHNFMFSAMPTGLYFVKVIADSYVETIKLVKTR
jgi:hypothetical protein